MPTSLQSISGQTTEGGSVTKALAPDQVQSCDFRAISTFDKSRLAPLAAANETFSRTLAQTLSAHLGLSCEVTLQSFDAADAGACLKKAGDSSYFMTLDLAPLRGAALLQIDSTLVFPLVDGLLGGSGKPAETTREITELEDHIVKDVVRIISHELQNAWRSFDLEVRPGKRQSTNELQHASFSKERVLASSFTFNLPEAGGGFQILLPVSFLTAFTRGAHNEPATVENPPGRVALSPVLAEKMADFKFGVGLALLGAKVRAPDLLDLAAGKILKLGVSVETMAVLEVGGRGAFDAIPVRSGNRRAAQLIDRFGESPNDSRDTL